MNVLGEISSYEDLHRIMRARASELRLSRQSIDAVAGLTPGYASILLSPRPIKKLGSLSMALILPALGMKLIAIVDEQKTAALQARITTSTRREGSVRGGTVHYEFSRRHLKKIQRKGGSNSRAYMTKKRASEIGRRAARARWGAIETAPAENTKRLRPSAPAPMGRGGKAAARSRHSAESARRPQSAAPGAVRRRDLRR
jgi:hypothetical protein